MSAAPYLVKVGAGKLGLRQGKKEEKFLEFSKVGGCSTQPSVFSEFPSASGLCFTKC